MNANLQTLRAGMQVYFHLCSSAQVRNIVTSARKENAFRDYVSNTIFKNPVACLFAFWSKTSQPTIQSPFFHQMPYSSFEQNGFIAKLDQVNRCDEQHWQRFLERSFFVQSPQSTIARALLTDQFSASGSATFLEGVTRANFPLGGLSPWF